jgi:hypothetical protein
LTEQTEKTNSIADIKRFFETPEKKMTMDEFSDFWNSCTDEEKDEFKRSKLE